MTFEEKEEELVQKEKDYYSLQYAEWKEALKEHQDRLKDIEAEMEKLDQTEELDELQDQLEEAKAKLLGYFLKNKKKWRKKSRGSFTNEIQL
ncbi:MAG: hypothetical protein LRY73_05545 [Bacillus sp. (in: Bacteria)]|nr:hypothetical protein [Bacillus sp. (in: firmicutes)]